MAVASKKQLAKQTSQLAGYESLLVQERPYRSAGGPNRKNAPQCSAQAARAGAVACDPAVAFVLASGLKQARLAVDPPPPPRRGFIGFCAAPPSTPGPMVGLRRV